MKARFLLLLLAGAGPLLGALDLTDGAGFPVKVDKPPRAVVSLTLMTDEFLADLLPPDRILAYSRSVDDPVLSNAVAAAKAVKGRASLNLESLVTLAPDLILAADWSDAGDLAFLRQKGYAVYVVKTPRSWAEVQARISDLGRLLSRSEAADQLLTRLAARTADLEKVRRLVTKPVTFLEYNSFGSSMGSGTLWNDMTALAGVVNLAASLPVDAYGYAPISRELLVKLDPDWLVLPAPETLAAYGQADFLQSLQADPLYRGLRAVRSGRVLFLSEALKTSTSHAVLGSASVLQHAAYPDLR